MGEIMSRQRGLEGLDQRDVSRVGVRGFVGLKRRIGFVVAASVVGLAPGSAALAANTANPSGGGNAGDVWTDNVGQPSGPGHEQDPHLACQNINLWGSGLADASGTYTIDGWAPSGSQEPDYAASWSYDQSQGGSQVIDVIDVKTLVANAIAHGDKPVNKQGLHFKLQLSQDPQKHKTFWVNCPAPSGGGTSSGGGSSSGGSTSGTPTPTTSPKATHKHHRKHHHRHAKLVHPKRHHKPQHRKLRGDRAASPAFTG